MTIQNAQAVITWVGNGATSTFYFDFLIPDATNLELFSTNAAGTVTSIASGGAVITGIGNEAGGTLTYPISGEPIAAGVALTLVRQVPYAQNYDPGAQGPLNAPAIMQALDNLEMQIQQLNALLARGVVGPFTDSANMALPPVVLRAGNVLGFDSAGNIALLSMSGSGGLISNLDVSANGTSIAVSVTDLNFIGGMVSLDGSGTVDIDLGIEVKNNGTALGAIDVINFSGTGYSLSLGGGTLGLSLSGGGTGGGGSGFFSGTSLPSTYSANEAVLGGDTAGNAYLLSHGSGTTAGQIIVGDATSGTVVPAIVISATTAAPYLVMGSGSITALQPLLMESGGEVIGSLTVTGNQTIDSQLTIDGALHALSGGTIGGALVLTSEATINGLAGVLRFDSDVTMTTNGTVDGSLVVDGVIRAASGVGGAADTLALGLRLPTSAATAPGSFSAGVRLAFYDEINNRTLYVPADLASW